MNSRPAFYIIVAPNGARRSKADHPRLPMTAKEVADCALACQRAGASVLHLHLRDDQGRHSLDPGLARAAMEAVKDDLGDDLILQVTSEAAGRYSRKEQMQAIRELRPDAASLGFRELCPGPPWWRSYGDFLEECHELGIWTQHIFYSPRDILAFADLQSREIVPEGRTCGLAVAGSYDNPTSSKRRTVDQFVAAANHVRNCTWWLCVFGPAELELLVYAAGLGWHPRTGFENNMWLPNGMVARDNAELVALLSSELRSRNYRIGSAAELRCLIN